MKHHVLIILEDGNQVTTTVKEFARQNRGFFPNYDFLNSDSQHTPTTNTIARFLCNGMNFKAIKFKDNIIYISTCENKENKIF